MQIIKADNLIENAFIRLAKISSKQKQSNFISLRIKNIKH
jgi:hypothetical protein